MGADQFDKEKTEQRLKAALRGAFSGPPTPLKDIPKKSGESRASKNRSVPKDYGSVTERTRSE
jgi:hypothetical protein